MDLLSRCDDECTDSSDGFIPESPMLSPKREAADRIHQNGTIAREDLRQQMLKEYKICGSPAVEVEEVGSSLADDDAESPIVRKPKRRRLRTVSDDVTSPPAGSSTSSVVTPSCSASVTKLNDQLHRSPYFSEKPTTTADRLKALPQQIQQAQDEQGDHSQIVNLSDSDDCLSDNDSKYQAKRSSFHSVKHGSSSEKSEKKKPADRPDKYSRANDSSDSENEDYHNSSKNASARARLLSFFNSASQLELSSIPHVTDRHAELIISLRPFKSYQDLMSKFSESKGSGRGNTLSVKIIERYEDIMIRQDELDLLLHECADLSNKLETNVKALAGDNLIQQPANLNKNFALKPYQIIGLNWLILMHKTNLNAVLADEMGLGKTIQIIAFFAHMKLKGMKGTNLIIVPSSTLDNWLQEISVWCPSLNVVVYYGNQEQRMGLRMLLRKKSRCEPDIILTTYTQMNSKEDRAFFRSFKTQFAVFDEAHMLKNCTTERYANLMKINAERRLLLTGTPLQNDLVELVSLLHFVVPQLFSTYTEEIKEILALFKCSKSVRGVYEQSRIEQAKTLLKPFVLRRLKADVLAQLPKKSEQIELCPMTKTQLALYEKVRLECRRCPLASGEDAASAESFATSDDAIKHKAKYLDTSADAEEVDTQNNARSGIGLLMRLRKAANHPLLIRSLYDDGSLRKMAKKLFNESDEHRDADPELIYEDLTWFSDFELHTLCNKYSALAQFKLPSNVILESGKFAKLDSLIVSIQNEGCKMLLFSQFVIVLDIVQEYLRIRGHKFLRLDGSTPVIERQELIEKFQTQDDISLFLLSTKAGGLGINLTAANYIILHDIDYNPYNDKQAEDRCHRLGQTKDVKVIKLLSQGSVEEDMLVCATQKLKLEQQVTATDGIKPDSKDVEVLLKKALERDFNSATTATDNVSSRK